MKIYSTVGLSLAVVAASLGGSCAAPRQFVYEEPIGPSHAIRQESGPKGNLVVFSAWDKTATMDSEHLKHTAYTILSEQGARVARVRNRTGSFDGDPETVSLAAGKYWIEGQETNQGDVRLAVVIQPGQTTVVYLDGLTQPPSARETRNDWIREPNGLVIGKRADSNSHRAP